MHAVTVLADVFGLVAPDAGQVVFEGQDLSLCDERAYGVVRRSIATVFQNSALFDSLTVAQNIAWPMLERDRTLKGLHRSDGPSFLNAPQLRVSSAGRVPA